MRRIAVSFLAPLTLFLGSACGHAPAPAREAAEMDRAWSLELTGPGGEWTPTFEGEHLLLVGHRTDADAREVSHSEVVIRRIHPSTGSVRWERALLAEPGAVESAIGDRAYVFRHGPAFEALAPSGDYLWGLRYDESPTAFGVGGGLLAVALADGTVNVRSLASGTNRWTLDVSDWTVTRIVPGGSTVYGLATRSRADGSNELGVFDFGRPHNTPAWTESYEAGAGALEIVDGRILGSLDYTFGVYDLATGEAQGDPPPAGTQLVGPFLVNTERIDGLELRLRSLRVRPFDADVESGWTQAIASAVEFESLQSVDDGTALLAVAGTVARLFDSRTGAPIWSAQRAAVDDDGRACTVLGALPSLLIERCDGVAGRVVQAMEVVP